MRVGREERERVVIPEAIAWDLIERVHKYLAHFGTNKVTEFSRRYFAIENADRLIRDVVASCRICLTTKVYTRATRGSEYYDLPDDTGKVVSIDLYGPLPRSFDGNNYAIVFMDQFSKYTKIYPIRNQKLKTLENVIENWYVTDMRRVPECMLTDCGGQFLTNRWREFADRLGFRTKRTSPYNPQSNPVERVMREIGRALRAYSNDEHRRWDDALPRVEQVINATTHASTGVIPAELEGRTPDLVIGPPESLKPLGNATRNLDKAKIQARQHLAQMAQKRKRQAEKHGTAMTYRPGDLIWIKSHRRSDARHAKVRKLFPLYESPFRVEAEVVPNAYKIIRPTGETIGTFNARQMRPHRAPAWRPREPIEVAEPIQSQASDPSQLTQSQDSEQIESEYEPGQNSPEPGPSRRRRRTRTRVSLMARKLSESSSDSSEHWTQPRTDEIESSPKSDDTWELIHIPRKTRKTEDFPRLAGERDENSPA